MAGLLRFIAAQEEHQRRRFLGKSEIQNPKPETNPKFEIQIPKTRHRAWKLTIGVLNICALGFGFVSDFEIRVSDLEYLVKFLPFFRKAGLDPVGLNAVSSPADPRIQGTR
jgi:hypothetical protein